MVFTNFSIMEKTFIASKIYAGIQKYFGHWEGLIDYNLDKVYQALLKRILQNGSRKDFILSLMEFIATLENGHSWVNDKILIDKYPANLGFEFDFIENNWVITSSQDIKFSPGSILEEIDGRSWKSFYEEKKGFIGSSSERAKRSSLKERPYLFPWEFTISCRTPEGERIEEVINQEIVKNSKIKKIMNFEAKWLLNGQIGYISILNFGDPKIQKKALEWIEIFSNASSIIFDLRGNIGGKTPIELISKLMKKKFRWWTETTPLKFSLHEFYYNYYDNLLQNKELEKTTKSKLIENRSNFEIFAKPFLKWNSIWEEPLEDAYQGDIVILADRNTRSAGEDFILPFKDNKRAVIVGETTRGTTGQPYMIDCGKGLTVFIGMKRAYFPDGSPFEGRGIEPDVNIPLSIKLLQKRKESEDSVLQKALEILGKKL